MLIGGCGSRDLTRSQALELIRKSPKLQEGMEIKIFLWPNVHSPLVGNPEAYEALRSAGYIEIDNNGKVALTPRGRAAGKTYSPHWYGRTAKQREVLEITGLTSRHAEGRTTAEFNWRWTVNALGEILQKAGVDVEGYRKASPVNRGTGSATFSLYDDGWRLDEIQFG